MWYPGEAFYPDWQGEPLMGIFDKEKEATPEPPAEPAPPTPEEKVELWRLGQLVRSYAERVAVLDEHDIAALEQLAKCRSDLHRIVNAFEAGCTLGQAMGIFL